MKSLLTNTGKLVLGLVLFFAGIGLFYAGCKYNGSEMAHKWKKFDSVVYIICFGTALVGISMALDALGLIKNKTKDDNPSL